MLGYMRVLSHVTVDHSPRVYCMFSNAELRGASLVIREGNGLFGKTICECLYVLRKGSGPTTKDCRVTSLL